MTHETENCAIYNGYNTRQTSDVLFVDFDFAPGVHYWEATTGLSFSIMIPRPYTQRHRVVKPFDPSSLECDGT